MDSIAVVSVNKNKYSETFIHSQYKLFPARVHFFYGAYLPFFYDDGKSFLKIPASESFLSKFTLPLIIRLNKNILIDAISNYCIKNNIKAILTHYGPVGLAMMEISQKTGIPLYVYFHGFDVYRASELKTYGRHYDQLFRHAAKVFAVSHEMVEQLKKMGAPASKIIYNPCGADTDLFKHADVSANPPLFISVGRFDDTKNHEATIRAFDIVNRQYPESRLKIIGEGKHLKKCKILATSLKLNKQIEFMGALCHESVAKEMAKARVFVLHSVTAADGDREGAPVSIMEAGAAGLPVVATIHAGINDIVVENETGFLVAENDTENMAECMKRFIENPLLAKQMGEKAALRIDKHFSLKRNVDVVWDVMMG